MAAAARRAVVSSPLVPAMIRTAAVDPDGNLWISLVAPYTYVYDERATSAGRCSSAPPASSRPPAFFSLGITA